MAHEEGHWQDILGGDGSTFEGRDSESERAAEWDEALSSAHVISRAVAAFDYTATEDWQLR